MKRPDSSAEYLSQLRACDREDLRIMVEDENEQQRRERVEAWWQVFDQPRPYRPALEELWV